MPFQTERERQISVRIGSLILEGDLCVPEDTRAVILIAPGCGSHRKSEKNCHVAQAFQERNFATLLLDLLSTDEELIDEKTRGLRFDIHLLSGRLIRGIDWLGHDPETRDLRIGCFGAGTTASAALFTAAMWPGRVSAVVSRGGRPDLAGPALSRVRAPTLLIAGSRDVPVMELNEEALQRLGCVKQLEIVPGAGHLFEETGVLERVEQLAGQWFQKHLN